MIIIADSGSTKTDWALVSSKGPVRVIHTQGINPVHQDKATIETTILQELQPQLNGQCPTEIYFYGSGVRADLEQPMQQLLKELLHAPHTYAHSDLLGAARALCGHSQGLACILGTGSNSCLFNGEAILQNTPALGYILGDEGSGAALGISFVNALYKGRLGKELKQEFEQTMGMNLSQVIDRVYRQPLPNRFLASLAPFIHAHLHLSDVTQLVVDAMRLFIQRNINPYQRPDLPLSAVGSIAFFFSKQLEQAANAEGYSIGRIERTPLHQLIEYHSIPLCTNSNE